MASINKVILVGNLGKDPELRYTSSGTAVANFTLATSDNYTDKSGQKQEKTEWHRIVTWGKTAEFCGEYLTKGRKIYLEGKIQTRDWVNKEGVKQYSTEVVANTVQFLDNKPGGAATGATAAGAARKPAAPGTGTATNMDDFGPPPPGFDEGPSSKPGPSDDDIPF